MYTFAKHRWPCRYIFVRRSSLSLHCWCRPFSGTTTQLLHAYVYEPLTIKDDVLRRLPLLAVEILQRSMAKSPNDRYINADEMAAALTLASGRTIPLSEESDDGNNNNELTGTMTMSSTPVSSVDVQPPKTILVHGKHRIQNPASTSRPELYHIPPPTLIERTRNLEYDIPASQQSLLDRLERFAWGRLAFAIIAVLLSAIIGATVFRSAFF